MTDQSKLACPDCGTTYETTERKKYCPDCDAVLEVVHAPQEPADAKSGNV